MIAILLMLAASAGEPPIAYYQAHRGGMDEAPENTLAALEHAWRLPGAVPEVDMRTTKDGVIVLIHDATPRRTLDAPPEWRDKDIREIPAEKLTAWDAGVRFAPEFSGVRTPTLAEAFDLMAEDPKREIYLDIKDVDIPALAAKIHARGFERRVIFVHGDPEVCKELLALYPGARTMTWLSGLPAQIEERFDALAEAGFPGISQLQFHLRPARRGASDAWALDHAFLERAAARTREAGVELQLRPFVFDAERLRPLLDLGVRWYVTDAPEAFEAALREAAALEYGDETQESGRP